MSSSLYNFISFLLLTVSQTLIVLVPLLLGIAYLTLLERKVIASIQRRKGPNVVGPYGLLQPLADGLKLFIKEMILPNHANIFIFIFAPIVTFFFSLITWCVISFSKTMVFADLNIGILYIFTISSLSIYGIITAGWSSNSKYAFLGALRSTAQMISYEVSIGIIIICVIISTESLNITRIVLCQQEIWNVIPFFPLFIMFFISALAETNRAPFDLPEAEAELVAGYNVEYSSMGFALFFLGEYANMILMCALTATVFLGGWLPPFSIFPFTLMPGYLWLGLKTVMLLYVFIWVRAAFPRYRYDQLMYLGWKVFLPISLGLLFFISSFFILFV